LSNGIRGMASLIAPGFEDLNISQLTKQRVDDPDNDEASKTPLVRFQKPSPVPADHGNKPERSQHYHGIPQSAVEPSVEHCAEIRILQHIKIGLRHFPEEVQEERHEKQAYLWYPCNPMSFQNGTGVGPSYLFDITS